MKVGDYARTNDGIKKVLKYTYNEIYENGHCVWFDDKDWGILFTDEEVNKMKPSSNIIDLIEENDLLKIEYFSLRYNERVTRLFEVTFKDERYINLNNAKCDFMLVNGEFNKGDKELEPVIKSIVTKEQFESMEYKL